MIVLDTNVVSALMRLPADPTVRRWADRYPVNALWITAVTIFEIQFGIELLPQSRRRDELEKDFARVVSDDFRGRVFELDRFAAETAAAIAARRQQNGRTIELRDALIAGIVVSHDADLATRNVRHFEGLDITLVNPWDA